MYPYSPKSYKQKRSKIPENLRKTSLNSKFTGFYKKKYTTVKQTAINSICQTTEPNTKSLRQSEVTIEE